MHSDTIGSFILEIIFISSAQKMYSGSSVHSSSSSLTSTIPTTSQNSLESNIKPGLSVDLPELGFSYYLSGPASAPVVIASHGKSSSRPRSNSSPVSTFDEKPSNASSGGRAFGHKGKSKSKNGCISGMKLDFHYHNLFTASGRGRSTLGTGSGAPAGCDLM